MYTIFKQMRTLCVLQYHPGIMLVGATKDLAKYVIDRPKGSCGVCDIPKVLRIEAE